MPGGFPLFPQEVAHIIPGGFPAGAVKSLLLGALPLEVFIVHLFGQLHARPLGQAFYSLGIGEPLRLHNELDHPAPCVAAKAIIQLGIRGDGKGRGLFAMEGTTAPKPSSLWLEDRIFGSNGRQVAF